MSPKEREAYIELVREQWGEEFVPIADDPMIKFSDSEIVVQLKRPIKTDEGETNEIRLREPTVKELKLTDMEKGEIAKSALLLKACGGGLPMASIETMKGSDFIRTQKVLSVFLADGQ